MSDSINTVIPAEQGRYYTIQHVISDTHSANGGNISVIVEYMLPVIAWDLSKGHNKPAHYADSPWSDFSIYDSKYDRILRNGCPAFVTSEELQDAVFTLQESVGDEKKVIIPYMIDGERV